MSHAITLSLVHIHPRTYLKTQTCTGANLNTAKVINYRRDLASPSCKMWQTDLVFYLVMFVILVISAVLVVLTHAGYFHTVRVRMATPHVQPRHFAYVVKTGPYKSCAEAFSSLAMLAPKKILFGIYYDDPDTVCIYVILDVIHVHMVWLKMNAASGI